MWLLGPAGPPARTLGFQTRSGNNDLGRGRLPRVSSLRFARNTTMPLWYVCVRRIAESPSELRYLLKGHPYLVDECSNPEGVKATSIRLAGGR